MQCFDVLKIWRIDEHGCAHLVTEMFDGAINMPSDEFMVVSRKVANVFITGKEICGVTQTCRSDGSIL